jgi:glycosyltransferase involved in cell wall biosynthesis
VARPGQRRNDLTAGPAISDNLRMDISVVVTTYNRADLLGATLDGILAQTHPAREVIVVNDGSTDDTAKVLAGYGKDITVITQPNMGVQHARNAGFASATAPFVAISDHDDLWEPRYLERQAALLAAVPGIEFSFANFRYLRDDGIDPMPKFSEAPPGWWDRVPRRILPEGWIFEGSIAGGTFAFHPIFPSAIVVSRALWAAVGGFDTSINWSGGEDGDFTLRCLYRARTAALAVPLVLIRRHGANESANLVQRLLDEVKALNHILAHHSEAAAYRPLIQAEIGPRRLEAFNAAFASFDHAMTRRIYLDIPAADRSGVVLAKRIIAGLPPVLARPINAACQHIYGGRVATAGPIIR